MLIVLSTGILFGTMNDRAQTNDEEAERWQPTGFRKISEVVAGVLAHLAGRPGDEETDRHPEAQRGEPKGIAYEVSLTPRERDVLRVLARDGGSNKAIARELDISPGTVKVLLKIVFSKLRLHNRTEAAVWYRERQDIGHLSPHHVREDGCRVPAGISGEGRYHQRAYRKCEVF